MLGHPLGEDVDEKRPLHMACMHGQLECISALLKRCADPDAQDRYGRSPTHVAIQAGPELGEDKVLAVIGLLLNPR